MSPLLPRSAQHEGFERILTIDGPSGSGKTRLLHELARRYSCLVLELGPIVRTVAWWAHNYRLTIADAVAVISAEAARGRVLISQPSAATLAASEVVIRGEPMRQRVFASRLTTALEATALDPRAMSWVYMLVAAELRGKSGAISGRALATQLGPAGLSIRLDADVAVRNVRKRLQRTQAGLSPSWRDDAHLLEPPAPHVILIDTTTRSPYEVATLVFRLVEQTLGWAPLPMRRRPTLVSMRDGLAFSRAVSVLPAAE